MPLKGVEKVQKGYRLILKDIADERTHRAVYEILATGQSSAAIMVPRDTGNLLQSAYAPRIEMRGTGVYGAVGYTAKYAGWVHEMSGKLKGKPRADFGVTGNRSRAGPQKPVAFGGGTKTGNYWDPTGEPQWMKKGFALIAPEIPGILKRHYSV